MNVIVLIWFFFSGMIGPTMVTRVCQDQACVDDLVARAEADPAVFHYEVLQDDDKRTVLSGVPRWQPQKDIWKN